MLINSLKILFAFCMASIVLSSCGLLLKKRTVANSGRERVEFGLPLIVYQPADTISSRMIVLLSGDGGWLGFNDSLATAFAKNGYHVIGFNSRTYFWHQKSPTETAGDFAQMIRKYSILWHCKRIVLSGYSFGADVVPFIYNRLPDDLKNHIHKLQLLSPYLSTDFKVRLSDLIADGDDDRTFKVKPEVERINIPVFCFYGADEEPKPLAGLKMKNFVVKLVSGNHHYQNSYLQIVSSLKNKLRRPWSAIPN